MRQRAERIGIRLRRPLVAGAILAAGLSAAHADPLPRVPRSTPASPCGAGGGLALPGSATCLRLGGSVRAEASATARGPSLAPGIVPTGRPHRAFAGSLRSPEARIDAETRTGTPYGPLRAYLSVKAR